MLCAEYMTLLFTASDTQQYDSIKLEPRKSIEIFLIIAATAANDLYARKQFASGLA